MLRWHVAALIFATASGARLAGLRRQGGPSPSAVPVIDVGPFAFPDAHDETAREACAHEWDRAMAEVGFVLIVGHGVPQHLVEELREGFNQYFNQSLAYKESFRLGDYGSPLGGYEGLGEQVRIFYSANILEAASTCLAPSRASPLLLSSPMGSGTCRRWLARGTATAPQRTMALQWLTPSSPTSAPT